MNNNAIEVLSYFLKKKYIVAKSQILVAFSLFM